MLGTAVTAFFAACTVRHVILFHWQYSIDIKVLLLALVGALTAWSVQHVPPRRALTLLWIAALVVPIAASTPRAAFSDDIYRYALDGRVQAAGIDPYRYTPFDPALDRFHDSWLFPDAATCAHLGHPPGCTRINRPTVHTIYPPVAEAWFLVIHVVGLDRLQDRGYQIAGLLVELAILAVLLALLKAEGLDRRLAAWWVLSPLPAIEIVGSGHVDGLAIVFSLAALLAWRRGHLSTATAFIALAALTKLYPGLLLVAVLPKRPREAARQVVLFVALFALAYLPHVIAVGTKVIGYLPGYLKEEHYGSGTRYLLLDLVGLKGTPATVVVAVGVLVSVGLVLWRRPPAPQAALWLYGAFFLLTTPAEVWYLASLVVVAVVCARPEWLAIAMAAYPLYLADPLDHDSARDGRISYGVGLAVLVAVSLVRRYRLPRNGSEAKVVIPSSNATAGA